MRSWIGRQGDHRALQPGSAQLSSARLSSAGEPLQRGVSCFGLESRMVTRLHEKTARTGRLSSGQVCGAGGAGVCVCVGGGLI